FDESPAFFLVFQKARDPGHADVGDTVVYLLFGDDVASAGKKLDLDAFFFVVALCNGDIVAHELRLRQPFQLKGDLVELAACWVSSEYRAQCQRETEKRHQQFLHPFAPFVSESSHATGNAAS